MALQVIDDPGKLISLGWESFVKNHPQATIFQAPEMYELFAVTAQMQPVVVGLVDNDSGLLQGVLLAAIIREMNGVGGYFSSRTVVYGGPLVETGRQGEEGRMVDLLLEGLIRRVKNKSVFIQFRNFFSHEDNKELFTDRQFSYRDRLNLLVDTSSRETVIKNMSESRWRQIRKGLGAGQLAGRHPERSEGSASRYATIIEPENIGQVREFYDILYDLYKYKVKKPLPGWDFFERFYYLSGEGKLGIIRLVKFHDRIIGGILSPVTPGKTIYEWYVCGLDQEYREVYPSVLATWAAIDYAIENDVPRFDFMGVGIPEREYGVRDFKLRFGGQVVNHGRFARINNRPLYFAAETGYNLLTLLRKI